jgi:outer membrane protein OmpA-like peptidoglycan-associated protein
MRALPLAAAGMAFLLHTVGAAAQETELRSLDLGFRTVDVEFRTVDLLIAATEVEGVVTDLAIEETETEIRIALSADVLFDFDSSDIKPAAADALRQVASMLRDHPDQPVRIEGHTDSKGSDAYNQALSEDRALSVKEWLAAEEAVDGENFEIVGFGESRPAAPNEHADGSDDPDGRQKNRRVEIVIGK